jgi:hypothetical protein
MLFLGLTPKLLGSRAWLKRDQPAGGSMAKVILARMDVAALLKLRGEIDRQLSTRRQQLEE